MCQQLFPNFDKVPVWKKRDPINTVGRRPASAGQYQNLSIKFTAQNLELPGGVRTPPYID